jgi:type I restriction enzyme S subunit
MEFLEEVEFVGDIPEDWKWMKVEEFAEVVSGGTPRTDKPEFWNGDIAWITPKDLSNFKFRYIERGERNISREGLENSNAKLLPKGTVLLSSRAPVGYLAIAKNELSTNQGFQSLIPKENIISEFLYYLLKNNVEYLKSQASGTTFGELSKSTLKKLTFLLPPLPEQKAIAEVLSSIDDKIELLHRQNKTLEEMAMTLFGQWFIEPTKDGLPDGWEEVSLGEFIKEVLSGDWGKDESEGEYKIAVNCIRGTDISDLQNGLPKKTPVRFLKESKFKSIEPKDGDIIIEISGGTENQSTGRAVYINNLNRQLFEYPIIFSNFCRLLRPKENHYTYYLYLYLKYLYINDEFFSLENGTSGIKNLDYKTLLYDLKYPMPKNAEIYSSFHGNVSILFEKIDKNKLQIQTLEKLRDTLLPKLMSGDVRVKF